MPLYTEASIKLITGQEDQELQVTQALWNALVPSQYDKGELNLNLS